MSTGWILLLVYLVGIPIVFFGSTLFDNEKDKWDEIVAGSLVISVLWPILLPIVLPVLGRVALHDYVIARRKAKKLRLEEKVRIEADQLKTLQRIEHELDQELASTSFRDTTK